MAQSKGRVRNCLICFDNVTAPQKRVKLPHKLGQDPVQIFQRVCEVLQLSFLEVQSDWNLRKNEPLPFCVLCCEVFVSVVQLQQQLADIHQKIEEKITSIRDKIRNSDVAAHSVGDQRTVDFRIKAGGSRPEEIKPDTSPRKPRRTRIKVPEPVESPQAEETFSSWFTSDPVAPQIQSSHQIDTLKPDGKPDLNFQEDYEDNNDDGNNSYFSGCSDNDQDSQSVEPDPLPKITRKVSVSEAFPFLPPHPPRENPFSKIARTPETFSPVITDQSGKMMYEGIQIIPVSNGYQCGQCFAMIGKDHSSIAMRKAKIHMKGFHLGGYKCSLCEKDFTSADILLQHLNRSHTPRPLVACTICGKEMKYFSLKEHMFTHMNPAEKALALASGFRIKEPKKLVHPCRICGQLTRSQLELKRHELTHIDAKFRKDYQCPQCPKKYSHAAGLREHIDAVHNELSLKKKLCKDCGLSFPKRLFAAHSRTHNKGECRHCCRLCERGKVLEDHERKCEAKGRKIGQRLECDICHKLFNSVNYLRVHKINKHKEHWKLKYSNSNIRSTYRKLDIEQEDQVEEVTDETRMEHISGDKYELLKYKITKLENGWKCECGQVVDGNEMQIVTHVKDWHIGPFKCVKCEKRFKNIPECDAHDLAEHENREVFPCQICGVICSKGTINKHSWSHKSMQEVIDAVNRGERLPQGGLDVQNQLEIAKSVGISVDFKCVLCNQTFENVNDLFNHRREEHRDAPQRRVKRCQERKKKRLLYPEGSTCHVCGKEFSKREYYLVHYRTMHGKATKRKRNRNKVNLRIVCDEDNSSSKDDYDFKRKQVKIEPAEEVVVKEEVVTSEEEDGADYMQGTGSSESEDEDANVSKRRQSCRDQVSRRSSRRQSFKSVNYAENDSDE